MRNSLCPGRAPGAGSCTRGSQQLFVHFSSPRFQARGGLSRTGSRAEPLEPEPFLLPIWAVPLAQQTEFIICSLQLSEFNVNSELGKGSGVRD